MAAGAGSRWAPGASLWYALALALLLVLILVTATPAVGQGPVLAEPTCAEGPTPDSRQLHVFAVGEQPVAGIVVFYRCGESRGLCVTEMEAAGEGTYRAVLPHVAKPADIVECYLVATDEAGGTGRLGSSQSPLVVPAAVEPAQTSSAGWTVPGLVVGSLVFLGLPVTVLRRRRRRKRIWRDQLYWKGVLGSAATMTAGDLKERLDALSSRPMKHYRHGALRWSRKSLYRKLEEVRRLKRMAQARERLAGADQPVTPEAEVVIVEPRRCSPARDKSGSLDLGDS
jgi:hypothetical protein